jgi:hypothetical protein
MVAHRAFGAGRITCQEGIQDGGVLFHQSLPPQRCPVGQYLITVDVSLQLVQQVLRQQQPERAGAEYGVTCR